MILKASLDSSGTFYDGCRHLIRGVIGYDVPLTALAFFLSLGNLLSKDPYLSQYARVPWHCLSYFLLGSLLSYMCYKRVQQKQHPSLFWHSLTVALIFLAIFAFFFAHLAYDDSNLDFTHRAALSAGSGIFFVAIYSLHVYHENKARVD